MTKRTFFFFVLFVVSSDNKKREETEEFSNTIGLLMMMIMLLFPLAFFFSLSSSCYICVMLTAHPVPFELMCSCRLVRHRHWSEDTTIEQRSCPLTWKSKRRLIHHHHHWDVHIQSNLFETFDNDLVCLFIRNQCTVKYSFFFFSHLDWLLEFIDWNEASCHDYSPVIDQFQ